MGVNVSKRLKQIMKASGVEQKMITAAVLALLLAIWGARPFYRFRGSIFFSFQMLPRPKWRRHLYLSRSEDISYFSPK